MRIEIWFGIIGGINFGMEKSWALVESLIKKYPSATWRRIINRKKGEGKYIVEVEG